MDMQRRTVIGLGLAGGLALAASARAEEVVDVEAVAARYREALEDIRAYAERHVEAYALPGLTVAVVVPGGAAAFMRFGRANVETRAPVGPDHLFQIGSISKSFTALCIFRLMEADKLKLSDDIRTYLPDAPLPSGATITIQHLLNHSSGLPDDAPLFPYGGDRKLWRGYAPGSHWSYSNLGFSMLSHIVERVSERPFGEYMQAEVLTPLGMTATKPLILTRDRALYATGYAPQFGNRPFPRGGRIAPGPWTPMVEGSGSVASTAADMARYIRFLIAAGQGRGDPLLSDTAAERFTKATVEAPAWGVGGGQYANGLAVVDVGGRKLLHHTGGMLIFNSAIHVDPIAGVGAFASTNMGSFPYRPRDITAYACARLRAVVDDRSKPEPMPAPPKLPDVSPYLGAYTAKGGEVLSVEPDPQGVAARLGGQQLALQPSGEDAFTASDPTATPMPLVFRKEDKTVVRAWWGETEYVREGVEFSAPTPAKLAALTGYYENDDPWRGSFRVIAQGPDLTIDGTNPLTLLSENVFRAGKDAWSPERLRFSAWLDGRPQRATASGADYLRRPA
ncbi:MAG: serine hydrolase domain-containing protein [Phenylobacterium sp.]